MIKISWGTKIAILYIGFVLLMGTMVAMCIRQKVELVSDDYYQKELEFQSRINQTKNADALNEKITHTINEKHIELKFPSVFKEKKITGEIVFFRPSDASKDYKTQVQLDEQQLQLIPVNKLYKGMYKMQIGWTANDTSYFSEETMVIP
jgi:hypothetical protein